MKAFGIHAAARRQLLVVHAEGAPYTFSVRRNMRSGLRGLGVNIAGVALLVIAAAVVALFVQSRLDRVVVQGPTDATAAAPRVQMEVDYLPAHFDEASLPIVPPPGQFSLVEGE